MRAYAVFVWWALGGPIGGDSSGGSGGGVGGGSASGHCIDIHSHVVSQGLHYVPGPNSCTVCVCDKGSAKWCKSVLCSPPQDCRSFRMGNSCCEFKCLDDILGSNGVSTSSGGAGGAAGNGAKTNVYGGTAPADTYDIALRLIASLVTAVLSLSLLFFLIHRLRRKKGAAVHRGGGGVQLHGHQLSDEHGHHHHMHHHVSAAAAAYNGIGYITTSGMGGYMPGGPNSTQQHPAPPGSVPNPHDCSEYPYNEGGYPLWKPAGGVGYFPRGEAPPPYEEAVRAARADAAAVAAAAAAAAALYDHHNRQQATTTTSTSATATSTAAPPVPVAESVANPVSLTLVHNTHVNITQHQHGQQQQQNPQLQQPQNFGNSSVSSRSGNDDSHQNDSQRQPLLPQSGHPQLRLVCRQSKSMLVNQVDVHSESGVPIVVVPANVPTSVNNNRKRTTVSTVARSRLSQMHPVAITTEVATSTSTFMSTSVTPTVTVRREPRAHRTIPANVQSTTIVPEVVTVASGVPVSTASRYASSHRARQSHRQAGASGPPHSARSQPSVVIVRRPADDSDLEDYRSECENCKSLSLENCSDELLNETMTLQRHPAESSSEQQPAYYRTSLTLPAHSKKLRTLNSAHRDAWFTPMQELSSSSDEE